MPALGFVVVRDWGAISGDTTPVGPLCHSGFALCPGPVSWLPAGLPERVQAAFSPSASYRETSRAPWANSLEPGGLAGALQGSSGIGSHRGNSHCEKLPPTGCLQTAESMKGAGISDPWALQAPRAAQEQVSRERLLCGAHPWTWKSLAHSQPPADTGHCSPVG